MSELFAPEPGAAKPAYRVLARKYRPADFSSLIGQEPMVRTLTNAFAVGRIAQAWMLTGVRGVGKTTTARILARALNYRTDAIDKPTIDLTEPGLHCQAIMEGRHVDVIEMDAASHTGIDDIREIIEQVRYAPVSARYKVYIIDEVHMLSTQAFNGLLKTLEEPPPHVKFIFATTEIRKVPITILSRTQRFDLRRIGADLLVGHLAGIAEREGIAAEPEALAIVARAAEGSARDALSILDQAIAHGAGKVEAASVRDMLGLADRARVVDLFDHLMRGDMPAALGELRSQYDSGADPATILTDLAEFTHFVTRLRFVPAAAQDASIPEEERRRGADFANRLSIPVLSRAWQMLLKGIAEVQGSNRPIAAAEMVLIRIAHAASLPTLDEALKALESGGMDAGQRPTNGGTTTPSGARPALQSSAQAPVSAISQGAGQPSGGQPGSGIRLAATGPAVRAAEPARDEAVAPATTPQPEPVEEVRIASLADIAALADRHRDAMFKAQLKRCVKLVRLEPGKIEIALTEDAPRTLANDVRDRLDRWTGRRWMVALSRDEAGSATLGETEARRRENAFLDAARDPTVMAVLAQFPGAKVIDVRLAEGAAQDDAMDGPEPAPGDPVADLGTDDDDN